MLCFRCAAPVDPVVGVTPEITTTPSSPMFRTCIVSIYELWIVADSLACNSDPPAPIITTITTDPTSANRAVTAVLQFCLHASLHASILGEEGRFSNPKSTDAHHTNTPAITSARYYLHPPH